MSPVSTLVYTPMFKETQLEMSIYQCPKSHASTEPDYCSECGTKIQGVPEIGLTRNTPVETRNQLLQVSEAEQGADLFEVFSQTIVICPDCTAPHNIFNGDFCEICGYNFGTSAHGEIPISPLVKEDAKTQGNKDIRNQEIAGVPHLPLSASVSLELIVTIDPSLRRPESPEPLLQQPIIFKLDQESNLIGRSSQLKGVYPEVALNFDSAVSQRHALLNRLPNGSFVLRDIGSTNGTKLNGVELSPMVDVPIKDGDEFTLGHWTRIKVTRSLC
ncbi:MAG: FHA domain-containing protein [Rhizonema sp. PD37]|nr:FHA domain-containing protein [Rhizonema sp. PD37]